MESYIKMENLYANLELSLMQAIALYAVIGSTLNKMAGAIKVG